MKGEIPSIKHYAVVDGRPKKGTVSTSTFFDSNTFEVTNILELFDVITIVREDPNSFIIRGKGLEEEQYYVRRLKFSEDSTDGNFYEEYTSWLCCDFDSYEVPEGINRCSIEAIEYLIKEILPTEFHNVTYIYQWSSSAGLEYNGIPAKEGTNVHLFFYLDRGLLDTELKAWFAPQKADGFDVSTFNTVTPIFVGSFVEKEDGIVDIIPEDKKFDIVAKEQVEVTVPTITSVHKVYDSIELPENTANEMLLALQSAGAVYKRVSGWIKLKHPKERTPGDWFVKPNHPQVIHHHVHDSMRIDKWLKQFYGIETHFKFPQANQSNWRDVRQGLYDKYVKGQPTQEEIKKQIIEKYKTK
jgi:hypothetical protein